MKTPAKKANSWAALARDAASADVCTAPAPSALTAADVACHKQAMMSDDETLPADTRELLRSAARSTDPDTVKAFNKAMGFTRQPGAPAWDTEFRRQEIDRNLAAAWDVLSGSDWERGNHLAMEIEAFRDAQWQSWQSGNAPPADATPLRAALFRAFKAGDGEVPGGWRAVRAAVSRAREVTALPELAAPAG